MAIHAKRALLGAEWARDVRVIVDGLHIALIETGVVAESADTRVDTLLPAPGNLHSHSFQRAMAGMTEHRASGRDNFWSWRELMYRFLNRLTPDQIEAIAGLVFMEMLEAGYAAVGEFHYVHHQPGGAPYDDLAELSGRICAAAAETGIGLTHLPVLYTYGGASKAPLRGGQLRFGNDLDRFQTMVQATGRYLADCPADTSLGVAPHSLRATAPDELAALLAAFPDMPIHIHAAEQMQEVEQVSNWLGARPVEWLLANTGLDKRWCLIHATHMTERETHGLAASGAVVGLCPITESNLGDGIFDGERYLAAGGMFGVGSDSNIRIALGEELRTFEYSQRLRDQARNVLASADCSVGQTLYSGALQGAARALNRHSGQIAVGFLADMVAIDSEAPALYALCDDQLLDGMIFVAGQGIVRDVWSAGRHTVENGRHWARDAVLKRYRKAIMCLLNDV